MRRRRDPSKDGPSRGHAVDISVDRDFAVGQSWASGLKPNVDRK